MVGQRIKRYRKHKGLTLVKLGEKLGITHGSLSALERGKSEPSASTITAFAENTDINISWLLEGKGPMIISNYAPGIGSIVHEIEYFQVSVREQGTARSFKEYLEETPTWWALVPEDIEKKGMFYFRVIDGSMSPYVLKNAIVGVDMLDDRITSGEIFAVWLGLEGIALKFVKSTGKSVIFYTANREIYTDIEISTEELRDKRSGVQIVGKLKYLQQVYS